MRLPALAAQAFLILACLSLIGTEVVAYFVLPDQIVQRAYPDYEIGPPRNPTSKPFFCLSGTGLALLCLSFAVFFRFLKTPRQTDGYWMQPENWELNANVHRFWYGLCFGLIITLYTRQVIAFFPVNLSVPPRGHVDTFPFLIGSQLLLLLMFGGKYCHLRWLKTFRESKITAPNPGNETAPIDDDAARPVEAENSVGA